MIGMAPGVRARFCYRRLRTSMVRLNNVGYEYRPGLSLRDLVDEYNLTHAKVDFDGCVVVINSTVIPAPQAQGWVLSDNESVLIVPILDGG